MKFLPGRGIPAGAVAVILAVMTQSPAVFALPGSGAETNGTGPAGLMGKAAPDFALTNLSGRTLRLSDFKGKVVLLDFWATWCAPCREEIPGLIQLQRQYASKGFTVVGVALDDEGAAVVKPVAQKLGINYPVVIGNVRVAAAYGGIQALPTTLLIGFDGKILKTYIGAAEKSGLERDIRSALPPAVNPSEQEANLRCPSSVPAAYGGH